MSSDDDAQHDESEKTAEEKAEERQRRYERYEDQNWAAKLSNSVNLDRSILALSMASLGVSATLIRAAPGASYFLFLYLSWSFFLVAIMITIGSFIASQRELVAKLEFARRHLLDLDPVAGKEHDDYRAYTTHLGSSAAVAFFAGLLFLLIFFAINFPLTETSNMADEQDKAASKNNLPESAPSPKLPAVESSEPLADLDRVDGGAPAPNLRGDIEQKAPAPDKKAAATPAKQKPDDK